MLERYGSKYKKTPINLRSIIVKDKADTISLIDISNWGKISTPSIYKKGMVGCEIIKSSNAPDKTIYDSTEKEEQYFFRLINKLLK